jgi:DNA replication protein DnaD|tara:strand:- start:41 stop:319 length:279 start_codon:yes stop_codon:yes gene_type:complete
MTKGKDKNPFNFNLTIPEQIDTLQELFIELQKVALSHPMNDPENNDETVIKLRQFFIQLSQILHLMNEEMITYYGKTAGSQGEDDKYFPTYH